MRKLLTKIIYPSFHKVHASKALVFPRCYSLATQRIRRRKPQQVLTGMQFSTTSSPASTSSSKVSGIEEDYEPVYVRQVEVEYLENYCSGGYHPVHIGDTIGDGRYEVVHKLGYGGSSTVWLAEDHESNRIVKLKILSSSSSSIGQEHQCLEHLQKCGNDEIEHPGKRYVPSLFDTFIFEGPNGSHRCLVTEVAGCSLAYTKEHTWSAQFKVDVGRAIAARMLLGLAYIHSKGIVHGGKAGSQSTRSYHDLLTPHQIFTWEIFYYVFKS